MISSCHFFQTKFDRVEIRQAPARDGKIAFFGQSAPENISLVETSETDVATQRVRELLTHAE